MTPVSVLPTSFSVPPAVPPYGVPSAPGFPMPPLPPGSPPVPLQMGSSSSQVGGPQPFVSGLLSNLMRHGVISLEPPSQSQVFLMLHALLLYSIILFIFVLLIEGKIVILLL